MTPTLEHVSASQVGSFLRCNRLWFLQKICKITTPASPAQAKGKRIHSHVEIYGKTGDLPVAADQDYTLVLNLSELIPFNKRHLIEHEFRVPTYPGGPEWLGFIDFADPHADPFRIDDFKTTSDFRYNKTPSEISQDPQMIAYAKWATLEYNAKEVELAHVYLRTKGAPKVIRPNAIVVGAAHIEEQWDKLTDVVIDMEALASSDLADDPHANYMQVPGAPKGLLDKEPAACGAYGGCFFREKCGLSVKPSAVKLFNIVKKDERAASEDANNKGANMNTEKLSLSERLALKKGPAVLAPPEVAPENDPIAGTGAVAHPPIAHATPQVTSARTVCDKCEGEKYIHLQGHQWLQCTKCGGTGYVGGVPMAVAPPPVATPPSILPPDAPVPGTHAKKLAATPPPVEAPPAEVKRPRGRPRKIQPSVEQMQAEAGHEIGAGAQVTQTRVTTGGIDPANAKKAAAVINNFLQTGDPAPSKMSSKVAEKTSEKRANAKHPPLPPVIYVDCFPTQGNGTVPTPLEVWLAPVQELLAEDLGLKDYGLLDYKSRAALATAIRECADSVPPALFVSSANRGAEVFLEVVGPMAALVIRAVR